jgi:hypothetical protein
MDLTIKECAMGGVCNAQGRNAHKMLVGKPEGKTQVQMWDIIRMALKIA